ncbi:Peroxiredoxin-like 2A/B/C - like 3 [Theobroma cacao]|nr:Peroxiredoxin-like 2A/B/C - like 3 [Theobroma cacao]
MAISLSTSLMPNTFQSNRNPKHRLTRVLLNQLSNFSLKHRENENKISTRRRVPSSGVSLDTADSLDTVKVFDLNGNGIPISDLWKDRKAVVAFARHFGCVLCRKRADYLASKKAKTFAAQTKFKGEVYADPSHSSYEALIFVSGVTTTFTPKAGLKIIQLYMEGYRQDWKLSFEEDTVKRGGWQQGGILVAGPGKRNISYIHKDKEAGDDPDIEDILKACCS